MLDGALAGKLCNVLIVDEEVAQALIRGVRQQNPATDSFHW